MKYISNKFVKENVRRILSTTRQRYLSTLRVVHRNYYWQQRIYCLQ